MQFYVKSIILLETFSTQVIAQLVALVTFFAFPIIQYLVLKAASKRYGNPQLWYLPNYGFRLVISNIPHNKTLTDLKYKTRYRNVVSGDDENSVSTLLDEILVDQEDLFLIKGYDQILISFKLRLNTNGDLIFVQTDKLGNKLKELLLTDQAKIVSDYSVNIKNLFNFDVKVAKRISLKKNSLYNYWQNIQENPIEQEFRLENILSVG